MVSDVGGIARVSRAKPRAGGVYACFLKENVSDLIFKELYNYKNGSTLVVRSLCSSEVRSHF